MEQKDAIQAVQTAQEYKEELKALFKIVNDYEKKHFPKGGRAIVGTIVDTKTVGNDIVLQVKTGGVTDRLFLAKKHMYESISSGESIILFYKYGKSKLDGDYCIFKEGDQDGLSFKEYDNAKRQLQVLMYRIKTQYNLSIYINTLDEKATLERYLNAIDQAVQVEKDFLTLEKKTPKAQEKSGRAIARSL